MIPQRHDCSTIGLLGGSFNPAHDGHREISLAALASLGLDAVWWLVSPGNPLKDANGYAPYGERLAQARRAAADPRIVVSDFEARKNLRYTVDTVSLLQALWPQIRFVWLMGADSLDQFHLWKEWRRLFAAIPIAVFARPGFERAATESEAAQAFATFRLDDGAISRLAGAEPPAWGYFGDTRNPASSTELRRLAAAKRRGRGNG